jgi:hypothetical protein
MAALLMLVLLRAFSRFYCAYLYAGAQIVAESIIAAVGFIVLLL